jgi:hypothetical protein
MSKEEFLEKLHSLPGWDDMTRKGGAGVQYNMIRDYGGYN